MKMHSKKMHGLFGLIALVAACKQPHDDLFSRGERMGLADGRMVEASGLVASSNAIAIVMLFLTGYAFGHITGRRPWLRGIAMVVLGSILVGITMALGG